MAKKKSSGAADQPNPLGWMTTFSDLVTLLLTFFVLLLTMSSMDVKSIQQAFGLFFTGGSGPLGFAEQGKLEDVARFLESLEQVPPNVLIDQNEIQEAIFKFDDVDFQRLIDLVGQDIQVLRDERGIVIQLGDYILFSEGTAVLRKEYLPLLTRLADVLRSTRYSISVEGHTDTSALDGGTEPWGWQLSLQRGMTVMKYFTEEEGLMPERFRVGGFGASKPIAPNDTPENRARNRRIEIVLYREPIG